MPGQAAASSPPLSVSSVMSIDASEPPMISAASVLATWRSASRSVWTYCRIVNATSEWPMRALSAFQSIFASQLVESGLPTLSDGSPRRTRLWEGPSPLVRFGVVVAASFCLAIQPNWTRHRRSRCNMVMSRPA